MSTPLWNWNIPGPSSPFVSIVFQNRVRGSPKLARIGCWRLNGFNGQGYACALASMARTATARIAVRARRRRTGVVGEGRVRLTLRAAGFDGSESVDRREPREIEPQSVRDDRAVFAVRVRPDDPVRPDVDGVGPPRR